MYVGVCPMMWRSVGMNMWQWLSIRMRGGRRISGVGIIDVEGIREWIGQRNVMDSACGLRSCQNVYRREFLVVK